MIIFIFNKITLQDFGGGVTEMKPLPEFNRVTIEIRQQHLKSCCCQSARLDCNNVTTIGGDFKSFDLIAGDLCSTSMLHKSELMIDQQQCGQLTRSHREEVQEVKGQSSGVQ